MDTDTLFVNLFSNKDYFTKVFSHLQLTDFKSIEDKSLLLATHKILDKYKKQPTLDGMKLYFETTGDLKLELKKIVLKRIDEIQKTNVTNISYDLLIDSTENWVKNQRTDLIIEKGIRILEGDSKDTLESLQEEMKDIVQLSFHSSLGHDYHRDALKRFQEYVDREDNIVSSGIELLDTAGMGLKSKLHCYLAESNLGKTMHLASYAVNASLNGFNVAIFTMEDGETAYASRLDVNIMNMTLDELKDKGLALESTFKSVMKEKLGVIKIKEFPTGGANVNHFKSMLQEWSIKDNFVPDIIITDYLQIMSPINITNGMYEAGKKVAEELRGLAVELQIPIISALQANRGAFNAQHLSMVDVSESIGIIQTVDTLIGITASEEHEGKQFLSVLKSRATDKSKLKPAAVYVNIEHQRVTDIDDGRKARVPNVVKDVMSNLSHTIDVIEDKGIEVVNMTPTTSASKNDDLSDIFAVSV